MRSPPVLSLLAPLAGLPLAAQSLSLYGAMIRSIRAVGGTMRGGLWYQGESDANLDRAPAFRQKFEALVPAADGRGRRRAAACSSLRA